MSKCKCGLDAITSEIQYECKRHEVVNQFGPVRTVTTTRHEIVPGRYNGIDVGAVNDAGIHIDLQWVRYTADELTAAIHTLTAIRDAMQANATA